MSGRIVAKVLWGVIGVGSFGLFLYECYLVLTGHLQIGFWQWVIAIVCLFFTIAATSEVEKL